MTRRRQQFDRDNSGYYDDSEDYSDGLVPQTAERAKRAVDWGVSGSIIAILVLTFIYAFSPVDAVPDIIPVAGQADDVAAIAAGGGSVIFMSLLRYFLRAAVATRVGRWGCAFVLVLAAIGAVTVFYALMQLFQSIF